MISIIDYGSGNLNALANIYRRLKVPYEFVKTVDEISNAQKLILPGVGAFDEVMGLLNASGLKEVLNFKVLEENTPILGICVGMQIMSSYSEEGGCDGLNWIPGTVKKFDATQLHTKPYLPHMGWNEVHALTDDLILRNLDMDKGFYFIHSYYYECDHESNILTRTTYGNEFTSSINLGKIYGTQFHPEKSHTNGVNLLYNFSQL